MSLAYQQNLPGIDAAAESVENEFLFGPQVTHIPLGVNLVSTAVDAGSTPTTTLRRGLILGKVTTTGQYRESLRASTDGSQEPVGVLFQTVNMYDPRAGAVRDKSGLMIYTGQVKTGQLYGFDEYTRRKLGHRFIWDDLRQPRGGFDGANVPANYTVLAADNGKHFFYRGAGAGNLTLPTIAPGLAYRFTNDVDQNLQIHAGNISGPGNQAAANVAFRTATAKAGQSFEIVADNLGVQWKLLLFNANGTAVTYS